MTFTEFQTFITPLAMHFGAVKDEPTWRLYHAALLAPPAPSVVLLQRVLPRVASSRRWFPTVEEFRADAEAERQAILKAHPHARCAKCRHSSGFVAVTVEGVERVKRCACFDVYLTRLERLGIGHEPLALPAAEAAAAE